MGITPAQLHERLDQIYVYNLTLREIGEILGVTESRVCQINRGILRKLRARLDAHEQLFVAAAA
jgi:RNA polymerase sigma factor for flagellar operon FliA